MEYGSLDYLYAGNRQGTWLIMPNLFDLGNSYGKPVEDQEL